MRSKRGQWRASITPAAGAQELDRSMGGTTVDDRVSYANRSRRFSAITFWMFWRSCSQLSTRNCTVRGCPSSLRVVSATPVSAIPGVRSLLMAVAK